jgi:hypothetical protein
MLIPKYWIKAVVRNPSIAKWYFHWRNSLKGKHTPLGDELPWVTYSAIDWFSHHLTQDMILFEWGSGGSTAFFSRRVKRIITIEHDPIWYQDVDNFLEEKGYKNISLRLVEPVTAKNIDPLYTSTDVNHIGKSFESYIKAINEYPDIFFDIVVVDGRARPGCMRQALPKIKPGGFLVLDNSDRTEYKDGQSLMLEWRTILKFGPGPYVNFPTGTTIWQRPF